MVEQISLSPQVKRSMIISKKLRLWPLYILKFFVVLPNFPFTTSETNRDYYLKHGTYELLHELPNDLTFRILGN